MMTAIQKRPITGNPSTLAVPAKENEGLWGEIVAPWV